MLKKIFKGNTKREAGRADEDNFDRDDLNEAFVQGEIFYFNKKLITILLDPLSPEQNRRQREAVQDALRREDLLDEQDRAEDEALLREHGHVEAPNDEWDEPMSGTSKDTGITSMESESSEEDSDDVNPALADARRAIDEADFRLVPVEEESSSFVVFANASSSSSDATPAPTRSGSSSSYLPTLPPPIDEEDVDTEENDDDDDDDTLVEDNVVNRATTYAAETDEDSEESTIADDTMLEPHPRLPNVFRPVQDRRTLIVTADDSRREEESSLSDHEGRVQRRRGITASMRRRAENVPLESSDPEGQFPSTGFVKKTTKGARRKLLGEALGEPLAKFVKYTDSRKNIRSVRKLPLVECELSRTRYSRVIGKIFSFLLSKNNFL